MKPEAEFYQWLKDKLQGGTDCVRIENCMGSGMPDVTIAFGGKEVWVELKCEVDGKCLCRKEQYAWSRRRVLAGGRVLIICKYNDNSIKVWEYPQVEVALSGRYLQVIDHPNLCRTFSKANFPVNTILFPQ